MKRTALVATGMVFAMFSTWVFAAARPQASDRQVEALMLAVKLLEEKPFDAKAKDVRASAMKWIIDTDTVSVTVCSLLVSGMGEKYTYASEMLAQYTIGMAAFKLSKGTDAKSEDGAQLAGVESALTAYQAILKERPAAKLAFLDDLLAKRSAGELADLVKKDNCVNKGRTAE